MSVRAVKGKLPWEVPSNPVLLKDDVGKSKPSAYSLPGQQFIYGKPLPRDEEGAREVTSQWNFHNHTYDKEPERDFKQLNKISVAQGLYKANQLSDFRRTTDARVKVQKGQNALPILIPEEDFRYGRPNRPSTPMKLVLGNCYGLEGERQANEYYEQRANTAGIEKPRYFPRGNKASVLSYQYNKQKLDTLSRRDSDELFKLSKFKAVKPKTNTYTLSQKSKWVQQNLLSTSQKQQLEGIDQQNQKQN